MKTTHFQIDCIGTQFNMLRRKGRGASLMKTIPSWLRRQRGEPFLIMIRKQEKVAYVRDDYVASAEWTWRNDNDDDDSDIEFVSE